MKKVETRTSSIRLDGNVSNDKVTELVTEKIEEVKNLISGLASGIKSLQEEVKQLKKNKKMQL